MTVFVVFADATGRVWRERSTLPAGTITNVSNGVSWEPTGRTVTEGARTGELYRAVPPEPDSVDQMYLNHWQTIREWLTPGSATFHRPRLTVARAFSRGANGAPVDAVTLVRRMYQAAAPWTDAPYAYRWFGACDPQGRVVTGPTHRVPL